MNIQSFAENFQYLFGGEKYRENRKVKISDGGLLPRADKIQIGPTLANFDNFILNIIIKSIKIKNYNPEEIINNMLSINRKMKEKGYLKFKKNRNIEDLIKLSTYIFLIESYGGLTSNIVQFILDCFEEREDVNEKWECGRKIINNPIDTLDIDSDKILYNKRQIASYKYFKNQNNNKIIFINISSNTDFISFTITRELNYP